MHVARYPRDNEHAMFGVDPWLNDQSFPSEIRSPLRIFLDRLRSLLPSARRSLGRQTSNRLRSTDRVDMSRVSIADDGDDRPAARPCMGPGWGGLGWWARRPG